MGRNRRLMAGIALVCLSGAGCVAAPHTGVGPREGDATVVRGCLSRYSGIWTYSYVSPQCMSYLEASDEGVMTFDVSIASEASVRFARAHTFPACVEIRGRLEMYYSSPEGFLIPSGSLIGRGFIEPDSITTIDCALIKEGQP